MTSARDAGRRHDRGDAPGTAPAEPGGIRRALSGVKWYWSSVMGDNHYERYLAHHERTHPGRAPMTKREYWRERTDAQDRNPGARCC